jgi:ATP-dependent Lon protease
METIGLLPLSIVLFPGSSYPLHIFESRYKVLVNEVMGQGGDFGINLVEDGRMFPIGCRAHVEKVVKRYDDGRMDIVVSGTERYQITGYRSGEKPYLMADTDPFEDVDSDFEYDLLSATIALYNQLVESVYGEAEEPLEAADWVSGGASFRIAQKAGLDLSVRQNLLEMRAEGDRLRFLKDYLDELLPKIREMEKIQSIIRNDGYLR